MRRFDRAERSAREEQVKQETLEHFAETFPEREREIADALYYLDKEVMRRKIIDHGVRPDGRALTQIRPIWCEVGHPAPHAWYPPCSPAARPRSCPSATLGSMSDVQTLDGISAEESKRYMHHYNMPPYSTGEARPLRCSGPPRDRPRRAG